MLTDFVKKQKGKKIRNAIIDHLYQRGLSIMARILPIERIGRDYSKELKTTSALVLKEKQPFSLRHLRTMNNLDIVVLPTKTKITDAKWNEINACSY